MKIYKAITSDQLEFDTRNGWQLEATHNETRIQKDWRQPTQEEKNHGIWSQVEERTSRDAVIFVVWKDEEVETREQHAAAQANKAWREKRELQDELEALKKQVPELEAKLERETRSMAFLRTERDDAVARKRVLEKDIAKLRNALGELRMKEILAS